MRWKWALAVAGAAAMLILASWIALRDGNGRGGQEPEPSVLDPSDAVMPAGVSQTDVGKGSEADAEGGEIKAAEVSGPGRLEVQVILDAGVDIGDAPVRLCGVEQLPGNRLGRPQYWIQALDARQRAVFEDLPYGWYRPVVQAKDALGMSDGTWHLHASNISHHMTVRVEPAPHIAGVVLDPDGVPIEGAEICRVGGSMELQHIETLATMVTSGSSGEFVITMRPWKPSWVLRVRAEGYAPFHSEPILIGTEDAVLKLGMGGSVSGTVMLDETDEVMPGMSMRVASEYGEEEQEFVTDGEGRFAVAGLSAGEHEILCNAPTHFVKWGKFRFRIAPGEETEDIEVRLLPCGAISGRVYCTETDEGIPGVEISMDLKAYGASSGPDGHYLIEGVPEGKYELDYQAVLPGYVLSRSSGDVRTSALWAVVFAGETTEGLDIAFSSLDLSGLRLEGQAVGEYGVPLAGALVRGECAQQQAMSGTDGRFSLLASEERCEGERISASLDGYVMKPFHVGTERIKKGEIVTVVMHRPVSISGVAVDKVGVPLNGVTFLLKTSDKEVLRDAYLDDQRDRLAHTGSDGRFTVEGLMPMTYWLSVAQPFGNDARGEFVPLDPKSVTLLPGRNMENARFVFDVMAENQVGQISGQVTNGYGLPIANALVYAYIEHSVTGFAVTDGDGQYRIEVRGAPFDMQAVHNDYNRASLKGIAMGTTHADFVMERGLTVQGRVLDAETRRPLEEFEVVAAVRDGSDGTLHFRTPDGSFVVDNLDRNFAPILVSAPGYVPTGQRIQQVPPEETVLRLTFLMRREVRVQGVVQNELGDPVANASIHVPIDGFSGASIPNALTDQQGRFTLLGAGEGAQPVEVRAAGYSLLRQDIAVPRGGEGLAPITLWRTGGLSINVTLNGEPVSGALLSYGIRSDSGLDYSYDRAMQGHSRVIPEAVTGEYVVTAEVETSEGGLATETLSFRVEPGQLTEVEIPLRSENAVAVQ